MSDIAQQQQAENSSLTEKTSARVMFAAYKDWRMAKILLLGLISGFPWILIASMMSLWLKSEGLSRTGIGLFGIVFTVYAFNMFWAPLVDRFRIPFLHKLGQRRSWIVLMQSFIVMLVILLAFQDPGKSLFVVSVLCFLIALCSATQDVAVDALRIELISKDEPSKVGAASAMATSGWWIGYGAMGSAGLFLAEFFEQAGVVNYWQFSYLALTPVVIISVFLLLIFIKEPGGKARFDEQEGDYQQFSTKLGETVQSPITVLLKKKTLAGIAIGGMLFGLFSYEYLKNGVILGSEQTPGVFQFILLAVYWSLLLWIVVLGGFYLAYLLRSSGKNSLSYSFTTRIYSTWYLPVSSFVRNYGTRVGIMIVTLVFLFKVGEAFLGRMSIIFYDEVGFSKSDIALYSKGYGTIALITFTIIGSFINARFGLFYGLLIGGIAMASTNLLFAGLAIYPEKWLFATAVVADQFTTAISTVALVAFLSQLCDRAYTATQYAALASLGNFSRTTLATASGVMVDGLDGNWSIFFIITTFMVVPSLMMLIYIRKDITSIMAGKTTKLL